MASIVGASLPPPVTPSPSLSFSRLAVASSSTTFGPRPSLSRSFASSSTISFTFLRSCPNDDTLVSLRQRSRSTRFSPFRCFSALTPDLKKSIDEVVTSNKVVLFMKGSKDFPQCGFSNTVVQILKSVNVQFETINILENEFLRQAMKEYSSWPTFPQLYIDGEFFGGCDIIVEAFKTGELQEMLEKAMCS